MPEIGDPRLPPRFWSYVEASEDGCWRWTGPRTSTGYGRWHENRVRHQAHRHAYQNLVADVQMPMVCDHLCYVRECVNPAHIEIVTNQENVLRGVTRWKAMTGGRFGTHCRRGHELTEENTYHHSKTGRRECRICRAAAYQRFAGRQRLKAIGGDRG